ncbi:MAG TPA: hypothetical protein VGN80_10815 [Devosiaceae bacterium]|jgi:hypothetical protein|nr:hypothetical protein [Devosiaceae bacterium]
MRITAAAIAVHALLAATPALAQQQAAVEGNWACRANIDGSKAGILTIFSGSYGYASANFGSSASGTGTVQMYSDGVTFLDGNLLQNAGVEVALMGMDDQGRDILSLNTAEKPILTCVPR